MGNVIINIDIWGLFGPTYLIARTKIALVTSHTNSGQGFVPMSCHKLGIVLVSTNLWKVSDRSSSFPANIRSLLRRPFEESNFCSSLQGEIYMICTETDRGTLWKLWWMPSKCRRWKIIRILTQVTKNEGPPRISSSWCRIQFPFFFSIRLYLPQTGNECVRSSYDGQRERVSSFLPWRLSVPSSCCIFKHKWTGHPSGSVQYIDCLFFCDCVRFEIERNGAKWRRNKWQRKTRKATWPHSNGKVEEAPYFCEIILLTNRYALGKEKRPYFFVRKCEMLGKYCDFKRITSMLSSS